MTAHTYGKLFLIPTFIGSKDINRCIPAFNISIIQSLSFFIVEELRSARRFLRRLDPEFPIDNTNFQILNEHTTQINAEEMLFPILTGHDMGLLSEAGLPCIADPGAAIVLAAQQKGIRVMPLIGPSSIFMALMASGLSGQNFAFHGYLPTEKHALASKLHTLELLSEKHRQAQIFMETPYRNMQMLDCLLKTCSPSTFLCIAVNLTMPDECIKTQTIGEWNRSTLPELHKKPAIFVLQKY